MRLRPRLVVVAALLAFLGCGPAASDQGTTKAPPPPRPGEDQMKEAMLKALEKPGAAKVRGMPKP
jgi:hypothetical protein